MNTLPIASSSSKCDVQMRTWWSDAAVVSKKFWPCTDFSQKCAEQHTPSGLIWDNLCISYLITPHKEWKVRQSATWHNNDTWSSRWMQLTQKQKYRKQRKQFKSPEKASLYARNSSGICMHKKKFSTHITWTEKQPQFEEARKQNLSHMQNLTVMNAGGSTWKTNYAFVTFFTQKLWKLSQTICDSRKINQHLSQQWNKLRANKLESRCRVQ